MDVLCMIHTDGHVAAGAGITPGVDEARLTFEHQVTEAAGITGWRLARLPVTEAFDLLLSGLDCPACRIVFPCGCAAELVIGGGCQHGSRDLLIQAVARVVAETGYRPE